MKKRAKQLAMLGLTVTMMCGTQITAFAADVENAPVPIETGAEAETVEIKVEANEEEKADVKEDVVIGTEVAEEEVEQDAPVVIPETEETNKVADIKGELTSVKFDGEVNGVITLTDKDFEESGLARINYVLYGTKTSGGTDMPSYFDITSKGDFGLLNPQDMDDVGEYKGMVGVYKSDLEEAGGTKTYTGTFIMEETETWGTADTLDFSITVKYEKGNEGGGTVTPEPEKDGWIKTEEGWKYYENGQKATGWKAVSENWYYFNEDGIMATGWVSVGGHWYYLNEDGTMASNQWIDGWYVDASGKML